jgi:hypothetical protein
MRAKNRLISMALIAAPLAQAAVVVTVDADSGRKPISPWLYGRNNNMSDDSKDPVPDSTLTMYREAGLRMLRENGGNNTTKYNWRLKLSSHPDWYNNVYAHDWTYTAKTIQEKLPGTQGLFGFQLLGKVAGNTKNNFNDWNYNQSAWWEGASQNLAGGGTAKDSGGSKASVEGDPSKYLVDWPADSTADILKAWFGPGGEGLDASRFQYWNMDNEPEIWGGTHDDVVSKPMDFETYFQKYLAVAKAVRARGVPVKLVGPVYCNDWYWWTWNNDLVDDKGVKRSSMEMFLKRIGEEEKATGLKLLDVFDIHAYPGYDNASSAHDLLQFHRLFWDTTYAWPGSNGIHMIDNKWRTAVPNFTFERVRRWMVQHLGEERPTALTEFGSMKAGGDVNVRNAFYASLLGTFADHGGEILTAWDWYPGWWEVLHLFSRHAQAIRVKSRSSDDTLLSAYSSISAAADTLTVILVNRDRVKEQSTTVQLTGFVTSGNATTLQLSNLTGETVASRTKNGLKTGSATPNNGIMILSLPPLSITAVKVAGKGSSLGTARRSVIGSGLRREGGVLRAGPVDRIEILDLEGRTVRQGTGAVELAGLPRGMYLGRSGARTIPVVTP